MVQYKQTFDILMVASPEDITLSNIFSTNLKNGIGLVVFLFFLSQAKKQSQTRSQIFVASKYFFPTIELTLVPNFLSTKLIFYL